ncbi:MAG: hypothetical protein JOZ42_16755 [Acetobacteraceae bacterium]|nr:hypothetical protein [Acetobacteraceae bacterium]
MPDEPEPPQRDYVGISVLIVAVLLFAAAYWLFPYVQHWVSNQDCIASGRVNCGR